MKKHTASFKEEIKTLGKQQKVQLIYDDRILDDEIINMVTYHYEGDLLKSIMKGLEIDININIPLGSEIGLKYGLLVNGAYEYIDYGKYIVYEVEKQEDTGSYNIICYDKLLYSMKPYEKMNVSYPISIEDYLKTICSHLQIDYSDKNQNFVNYSKIIPTELYLDNLGTDLEYTFRDVLDEIAQATASVICINNDDELEVRYINDTGDTIDEEYLKDVNVNFGQKYGKINSIVLSRSAESDNVFISDEDSIEQNGLCEIKIIDNQIMNFNNRDEFLPEMFNMLNGLEYCINDFSSTGVLYYDILDRYNVRIGENSYSCIMLNDEINITQGLEEVIYTNIPEISKTDYSKSDKTDRRINQTYLIVDKQNQKIESVVSLTTEQNEKINRVTQTVDELNSKISDIADTTISSEKNTAKVELENINESEPIRIVVRPIVDHISYLYPSPALYPSADLYPRARKLRFENTKTNKYFDYEIPDDLFYHDSEHYDEFILDYDSQTCVINKRVGFNNEDRTTYILENPETIEYDEYPKIPLTDGDYVISIYGYDVGYLFVRLMVQNIYTTQFATRAELNSEISQTTKEINLSVDQKLELYPTTEEMTGAINVSAGKITQQVQQKVGNDEIIAKINLAVQDKQGIINLTGNQVTIDSDYFTLDKDGKIDATAGKLANWNVEENKLSAEGEAIFIPTPSDVQLCLSYIKEKAELSDLQKYLYDIDGNGEINVGDVVKMLNIIKGTDTSTKKVNGKIEFFSNKFDGAITLTNTETGAKIKIGLAGIEAQRIIGDIIATNLLELGAGFINLDVGGEVKKVRPCGSYTHGHTYQFDAEDYNGINAINIYVDNTYYGRWLAIPNGYKTVTTPATNENVNILTSKTTYLEVQDGTSTHQIFYDTSDSKLKDNMKETEVKALEIIDKIKHYSFDWKHNKEHVEIGYKADELYEQDKMLANKVKQQDDSFIHQFNSNTILALSTKAIQELNAKIEKRDKIIEFLAEKLGCKNEVLEMLKEGE